MKELKSNTPTCTTSFFVLEEPDYLELLNWFGEAAPLVDLEIDFDQRINGGTGAWCISVTYRRIYAVQIGEKIMNATKNPSRSEDMPPEDQSHQEADLTQPQTWGEELDKEMEERPEGETGEEFFNKFTGNGN